MKNRLITLPDFYLDERMADDKKHGLENITDLILHDIAEKQIEQLAQCMVYAYLNELPAAELLFNNLRSVEEKHLYAIDGDREEYENCLLEEAENDRQESYEDDRDYYESCFN